MPNDSGSITISRQGNEVVVYNSATRIGIGLHWPYAEEFARTIRRMAHNQMPHDPYPIDGNITIHREDTQIIIEWQGKVFFADRVEVAVAISNAVTVQAKPIEEEEVSERIIAQEAENFRGAWMPFGLSANPYIRKRAEMEAAYGDARKYIPLSKIDSQFHAFPPSIKQLSPDAPWTDRVANLDERERDLIKEILNGE